MRYLLILAGTAVIATLAVTPTLAQTHAGSQHESAATWEQADTSSISCPMMSCKNDERTQGADSKGMMERCKLFSNLDLDPMDPAILLAVREGLRLTDTQVTELRMIDKFARTQARALLTTEQEDWLEQVAAPLKGTDDMSCPMME